MSAAVSLGRAVDRLVSIFSPGAALRREVDRQRLARVSAASGYDAADPSRLRKHHRDSRDGDALSRSSAVALRNQARHLDRNSDIVRGGLDKISDFVVGANGITVEPLPRRADGSVHEEAQRMLREAYEKHRKWPEVTWTHNGGSSDRLACRTWVRDGECLGQLVSGPRSDLQYGSDIPVATELMEPDLLPHWKEDSSRNIHQGIERNDWGRPIGYHCLKVHPGNDTKLSAGKGETKRIPAERMLHLRSVDRIHQLRGVSMLSSSLPRLEDIAEYDSYERIANKMAASLVLKINRGSPDVWGAPGAANSYDPLKPPVYQMDGGMIVFNGQPGEDAEFFDTKRPNSGAVQYLAQQMRFASAGFAGLSYSAFARDYNGTYSAQRQELVENWPHYHALTGQFVAQWSQPEYEEFVRWFILTKGLPSDVMLSSVFDALFFGPAMPWIDPEKEANAQILLVQACFKSSAQVIRERGGSLPETYRQIATEVKLREKEGIRSTVDVPSANVSPAKPSAPEAPPAPRSSVVVPFPRPTQGDSV